MWPKSNLLVNQGAAFSFHSRTTCSYYFVWNDKAAHDFDKFLPGIFDLLFINSTKFPQVLKFE